MHNKGVCFRNNKKIQNPLFPKSYKEFLLDYIQNVSLTLSDTEIHDYVNYVIITYKANIY